MRYTHGHGSSRNPTYSKYQAMKQRCLNPKHVGYPNYGGRGVKVCQRWLNSFENFLEDMGEAPTGASIDRVNSDGDYEPSNCRWATRDEQANNTRANVKVEVSGMTFPSLKKAAEHFGISYGAARQRIQRGASIELALTAPPVQGFKGKGLSKPPAVPA